MVIRLALMFLVPFLHAVVLDLNLKTRGRVSLVFILHLTSTVIHFLSRVRALQELAFRRMQVGKNEQPKTIISDG